jgi:hypothetical protein
MSQEVYLIKVSGESIMGLLRGKPKVGIREFWRDFYDRNVFKADFRGVDLYLVHCQTVFNWVVEADKSFKLVDFAVFHEEMTAIHMELFALAWRDKGQFPIAQSFFTKSYLEENKKTQIWDIMGEYNLQLSRSDTLTVTGKQVQGLTGKVQVATHNAVRANMFNKWAEVNIKDRDNPTDNEVARAKCVARVANRIGVDITSNDSMALKLLTATLTQRLGCDERLHSKALFILSVAIFDLYRGAKDAINDVDIQQV